MNQNNTEIRVLDEAYKIALQAAVQASDLVLKYWPNPLNPRFDSDRVMEVFDKTQGVGNYATMADAESEDLIMAMIQASPVLRGHAILAEESGGTSSLGSAYQWIIDPIDGTHNFRNGTVEFGISIGLVHENEAVIGVIAMPAMGQMLVARKGGGAKLLSMDGKQLVDLAELRYEEPLDKALIAYDTGYENRLQQMKDGVEKIADKVGCPVAYSGASAANYRVAMAQVGAYFHQTPTKYDVAAAAVIITEAGGVVTDFRGEPIDWSAPAVSYLGARTADIHRQLLKLFHDRN